MENIYFLTQPGEYFFVGSTDTKRYSQIIVKSRVVYELIQHLQLEIAGSTHIAWVRHRYIVTGISKNTFLSGRFLCTSSKSPHGDTAYSLRCRLHDHPSSSCSSVQRVGVHVDPKKEGDGLNRKISHCDVSSRVVRSIIVLTTLDDICLFSVPQLLTYGEETDEKSCSYKRSWSRPARFGIYIEQVEIDFNSQCIFSQRSKL